MRNRFLVAVVAGAAFVVAAGLAPPVTPAYAAGTCSLAPLVCANDSAPGCEIICGGDEQATCVEGSCSAAGNILTVNKCSCK